MSCFSCVFYFLFSPSQGALSFCFCFCFPLFLRRPLLFTRKLMRGSSDSSSSSRLIICCEVLSVPWRVAYVLHPPAWRVRYRGTGSVSVFIHPERQRAAVVREMRFNLHGARARTAVCEDPRLAYCPCATSHAKQWGAILLFIVLRDACCARKRAAWDVKNMVLVPGFRVIIKGGETSQAGKVYVLAHIAMGGAGKSPTTNRAGQGPRRR